jgi:LysM repeat protein
MAIKDLPKYKDIRNSIRRDGRYPYRPLENKDTIVIHHSLTPKYAKGSTPEAFANFHIDNNGWHGCAYPFVITHDGTIHQTDDLDRRNYHAGNTNDRSIGICVAGDFRKGKEKPTQAQLESLYLLVDEIQKEHPQLSRVLGHQECPGYAWKNCPGDGWNFRKVLDGTLVVSDDVKSPADLPDAYIVQEGDTFWSIAKELEGIDLDELMDLNPSVDPKKLKVGMTLKLAKSPTNSIYTVKHGDTIWGIARAYKGVEVSDIKGANNLKSDIIQPGDKLVIPNPSAPSKPAPAPKPKPKKEYAYFPPGHGTWSVYPTSRQPVKANAIGAINPSKFGGLEYQVLGHPYPDVVTIRTSNWGKVNIFVGDSQSRVYKR